MTDTTTRSLVGDRCQVHGGHRPAVRLTQVHHIWPLGMGGPDVPSNRVSVCPTGHANIHVAIRNLLAGRPAQGTRVELRLAREGVAAWKAGGSPGRPE